MELNEHSDFTEKAAFSTDMLCTAKVWIKVIL